MAPLVAQNLAHRNVVAAVRMLGAQLQNEKLVQGTLVFAASVNFPRFIELFSNYSLFLGFHNLESTRNKTKQKTYLPSIDCDVSVHDYRGVGKPSLRSLPAHLELTPRTVGDIENPDVAVVLLVTNSSDNIDLHRQTCFLCSGSSECICSQSLLLFISETAHDANLGPNTQSRMTCSDARRRALDRKL